MLSPEQAESIKLLRDCDATLVPAGTPILLPEGTEVVITQSLGGNYTVNIFGNLARIEARDADALGKESNIDRDSGLPKDFDPGASIEEQITAALKTCYDPEIPVDILSLGLIYNTIPKLDDDGLYSIDVVMTLTAPGCGIGPLLVAEVEAKLKNLPKVKDVQVELVFDPPWDQGMMSEEAKLQLNMF